MPSPPPRRCSVALRPPKSLLAQHLSLRPARRLRAPVPPSQAPMVPLLLVARRPLSYPRCVACSQQFSCAGASSHRRFGSACQCASSIPASRGRHNAAEARFRAPDKTAWSATYSRRQSCMQVRSMRASFSPTSHPHPGAPSTARVRDPAARTQTQSKLDARRARDRPRRASAQDKLKSATLVIMPPGEYFPTVPVAPSAPPLARGALAAAFRLLLVSLSY